MIYHVIFLFFFVVNQVDEILLLRYMKWSTNFRGLLFNVEVTILFKTHEFYFI